jgi:hypothetical protein
MSRVAGCIQQRHSDKDMRHVCRSRTRRCRAGLPAHVCVSKHMCMHDSCSHLLSSCCRGFAPCAGPLADTASCTAGGVLAAGAAGALGAARCCSCCCCCCCCSKKAGVSSAAAPAAGEGSGAAALGATTGDTVVLGPRCAAVCLCCAALSRPCSPPIPPVCTAPKQGTDTHARVKNTGRYSESVPADGPFVLLSPIPGSQWVTAAAGGVSYNQAETTHSKVNSLAQ